MNKVLFHVDVDSPIKLMDFYKINDVAFSQNNLEVFYKTAWERALEFFDQRNTKATFFVVGNELNNSEVIQNIILQAHNSGHEIENHTYSHPFGLASLSEEEIRNEIILCNLIIEKITKTRPIGFRSPGYSINTKVINTLENLNFKYDSSGFWSIMNPMLKISQNIFFKNGVNNGDFGGVSRKLFHSPYFPHSNNWLIHSEKARNLLELPLPRTNLFGLPFYNNFNLWAPSFYSYYISKNIRKDNIVYLFHIIEFMDLTDNIPKELAVHPNIKIPVKAKMKKSGKLLANLLEHYEATSTRCFVSSKHLNLCASHPTHF
jgi:peptidoglycan/xylan/chitin deacetylase (PgdA/CDA1 family)